MFALFIVGTAGSGKSLLTSALASWYSDKGAHAVSANLDPGTLNLPYEPDVDIREMIDFQTIMNSYQLGPNGALIFAADLIASRMPELQDHVDSLNPDYVIFDTPGQLELFAYRQSGPFVVQNFRCEGKAVLFLFDSTVVSTAINFVAIAMLAASIQLRLPVPNVSALSKKDLVGEGWKQILRWSSDPLELEKAIATEAGETHYLLTSRILRGLVNTGIAYEPIPVSAATMDGMGELSATLSRIFRGGEEVED